MTTRPRHRQVLGALSVLGAMLGSLAGSAPSRAADGRPPVATPQAAGNHAIASAWLGGIDMRPLGPAGQAPQGLSIVVRGTPGAEVRLHVAGRPPMTLTPIARAPTRRGSGPQEGRYEGRWLAAHGGSVGDPALPARFLVELDLGEDSATAVVEPADSASAAGPAPGPGPTIDDVTWHHQGTAERWLVLHGTPGAQVVAWVPRADGGLRAVLLQEHERGHYRARLGAGAEPLAVELASGRHVVTLPMARTSTPVIAAARQGD